MVEKRKLQIKSIRGHVLYEDEANAPTGGKRWT